MKSYKIYVVYYGKKTAVLTVDYMWQAQYLCECFNKNERKGRHRQLQGFIWEETEVGA